MTPRQTFPRPNSFGRNLRSKTRLFTGFCNSHQASHFATFFIDARAEIFVVESSLCYQNSAHPPMIREQGARGGLLIVVFLGAFRAGVRWSPEDLARIGRQEGGAQRASAAPRCLKRVRRLFCCTGFDNDPSAGSPMETLLRLFLHINDKVQWTSHDFAGSERTAHVAAIKHFTKSFNR